MQSDSSFDWPSKAIFAWLTSACRDSQLAGVMRHLACVEESPVRVFSEGKMAFLSVFCRHRWGVPMHGQYTCLKCGRVRKTEAITYDAERDRRRIQSAKIRLERELAAQETSDRRIA